MMGAQCFTACKCKDPTQGSPYLACSVNHSWNLLLVIEAKDRFKNGRKACNCRPRVLLFISCFLNSSLLSEQYLFFRNNCQKFCTLTRKHVNSKKKGNSYINVLYLKT